MENALKHLKRFLGLIHILDFWLWVPSDPTCDVGRKRYMHTYTQVMGFRE